MQVDIEGLCAELRAHRSETAENRKMLPAIRARVRESQVARVLQPRAHGGLGGPLRTMVEVLGRMERPIP